MKIKNLRWYVIGLIALATVINYIDRQALPVLWPDIAEDLYPDKTADERKEIYAIISTIFIFSYAFGQAIFGKIFDKVGTRIGFTLSIGFWSVATALHAFARGVVSLSIFRSLLGISEAGNWPGAAKGNAEWFPTKERAFAQGIFNSGAAIGGIIAFPVIGLLSVYMGWQYIFIIVGLLGLLWLIPWWILVKSPPGKHPWITEKEQAYILTGQQNQDLDEDGTPDDGYNPTTSEMLSRKESWGVIIASAAIDPIWWLFIFWIPLYLHEVYGMNVKEIGFYAWVPYVGAMIGAWFGGLLAQNRIKAGWTVNKTRKLVITLGCLIMLPTLLSMPISGKPAVLAMFGVNPSTAKTMADSDVKKLLGHDIFVELVKDQDFIEKLEGKDTTEIANDAQVVTALTTAKFVDLVKDEKFIKSLEDKDIIEITADSQVIATSTATKFVDLINVGKKKKIEKKEDKDKRTKAIKEREDFIKSLKDKENIEIKADAQVVATLTTAKFETQYNGKTLASLGILKDIANANNVSATISVLLMAIILFGFQTAIGNVQTLPSDLFGGKSVGTLAGYAGMAAKLGAFGLTALVPWLTSGGNYTPAFIIGAALALTALAAVWLLCPKIEPLKPIER